MWSESKYFFFQWALIEEKLHVHFIVVLYSLCIVYTMTWFDSHHILWPLKISKSMSVK